MRDNIIALLTFLIFLSAIVLILVLIRHAQRFQGNPIKTVVTLIGFENGRAPQSIYSYRCNDQKIINEDTRLLYQVVGEKYMAEYDSSDCLRLKIFYDQPLFQQDEKVEVGLGTIVEVGSAGVVFSYIYKNKSYKKLQYIESDSIAKKRNIQVGKQYNILIWVENPNRSIIYFDNLG